MDLGLRRAVTPSAPGPIAKGLRLKLAVALAMGATLTPSAALGYCRSRTCTDTPGAEPTCRRNSTDCVSEGLPLVHPTPCLSYGVARRDLAVLGITNEQFLEVVEQAFERWQTVDCGDGQTPGLYVQSAGLVNATDAFYCDAQDLNLGVWSFDASWDLGADAIGNTGAIFDPATGEIVDADVELNLNKIAEEYPSEAIHEVLLSIATHEAGHFLGLAHTDHTDAIMFSRYNEQELTGRVLTPDDIDGICEIFPPETAPTRCPKVKTPKAALNADACDAAIEAQYEDAAPIEEGCNLSARGAPRPNWLGLGFAGLLLAARRRGRARSAAACMSSALLAQGCLDDPLTYESLAQPDAATLGNVHFGLETGDIPDLEVLAVRVVNVETGSTIEDRALNLNYEVLDLQLELTPGDYLLSIRGVTTQRQVCAGQSRFEVRAGELARIDTTVVCDPEQLSVGQAKLTVATRQGEIIGTTVLGIDQLQLTSSSFVELEPGSYVVWVTAATAEGQPCAGSTELKIEANVAKTFDLEVVCER